MLDNDEIVLEEARDAAFALEKQYRRLIHRGDLHGATDLREQVEAAYDRISQVRQNLLEGAVLASDEDVKEMRLIRGGIEQAAQTQQMIEGAVKLIGKLARFV